MHDSAVPLHDVVRSLAFVGDLSMGQPTDHSPRAAWMASQLAREAGLDPTGCERASVVSLLRWSGCTANAPEFAQLFGDDINGRKALLSTQSTGSGFRSGTRHKNSAFLSLSRIHCEVSGDIAVQLGLDAEAQFALRHLFESHDGSGAPDALRGEQVPVAVYLAAIAGDLDIFTRLYGVDQACELIDRRGDALYPRELAQRAITRSREWLAALDEDPALQGACSLTKALSNRTTSLEILADVSDLKLPWMTGHSRLVAEVTLSTAVALGLDNASRQRAYRAALIHGVGRASVPNMIWDTPGRLPDAAWERVRLSPYWTGRAARQIGSLSAEAEIASYAYERADGSGYFRESKGAGVPLEARIVGTAAALVAMRAARPWRDAHHDTLAAELLSKEASAGRFDTDVVQAMLGRHRTATVRPNIAGPLLTEREAEVLRWISFGASNKVVAQKLGISPSTVRTHVESVFRKLECSTRAAATLKASQLGLL